MKKILVAVSIVGLAFSVMAQNNVTLAWDASPDASNVATYQILYGTVSGGDYLQTSPPVPVGTLEDTVLNLAGGARYYFVCVAVGTNGLSSAYSNEVFYDVPIGPPVNLRIVGP